MKSLVSVGLLLSVLVAFVLSTEKKLVCYYGTWAVYRNGNGAFAVNNIDPLLCTHLIYAFVGLNLDGTVQVLDPWLDLEDNWGLGAMKQFNSLKLYNSKLKTLVAIGGWSEGSYKFSVVVRNSKLRAKFAKDAAEFCLRHGFDGLDVDWEYPGQRDGEPAFDRENFSLLLADIRQEFDKAGLLLTAAVAATRTSASISYDIPEIVKSLDFINVMAYDLHGPWEPSTGHNAPLLKGPYDNTPREQELNVISIIRFWIESGAPLDKLVLGVPFYGRSFTLRSDSNYSVGAASSGPGQGGQYTYEAGFLGYNEICEKLTFSKWNRNWDENQKVPFAFSGTQWVGYDDVESLSLKVDVINQYGLSGVMVWSVETDDFRGICGEHNILLKTLVNALEISPLPPITSTTSDPSSTTGSSTHTTPITTPTSTLSEPSSTTSGSTESTNGPNPSECSGIGYFRDSHDCAKFYYCDGVRRYDYQCPLGLYFDLTILVCNWSYLVDC